MLPSPIIVPKYGSVLSLVAYFRSTSISFEKWNKKWNNSSDFIGAKPSKAYFKYKTHQKRSNAKKALNDLLSSKFTFDGDYLEKRRRSIDFTNNKNRRDSWSFKSWEESSSQSQTYESNSRNNKFRTESDEEESDDDDDNDDDDGLHSERIALGLPINGPLTVEEVKNAFHSSALKWHPDKHRQGSSQALAQEKFKVCLNAYKSLASTLSKV